MMDMIDEEKGEPAQPKLKPLNDATRYALADVLENGSLTPQQISVMMQGNQEEEQDEIEQGPPAKSSMMMAGRK
jgi:hypothetical protein